ncbi:pleckstrin homology domain-containing family G member 6 isoform X1 [Bos taurus]|uniref:pleckstrin homology domain-containing family G member 6 isoform X1 n=1 Tax=Bos taurus TaxID=9913 RepID=UPI0028CB4250|nr:pleckstrin homology domain-containing family G member 6 isoform X1 [Bos taurus]XP_059743075.1 pleckstrin homology domain-containing family G member 6 isoform X1 [Bos taurus]
MQALGPPDKSPLQGLVASRIETYGGRYRASVSSPPGNVYPQGGLLLDPSRRRFMGYVPFTTGSGPARRLSPLRLREPEPEKTHGSPFGVGTPHSPKLKEVTKAHELQVRLHTFSMFGMPRLPREDRQHWEIGEGNDNSVAIEKSWKELVPGHKEMSRDLCHQQEALWELLTTELIYVRKLKIMTDLLAAGLLNLQRVGLLTEVSAETLFGNVPNLIRAHRSFWEEVLGPTLEDTRASGQPLDPVSLQDGFLTCSQRFQPYVLYCLRVRQTMAYAREQQDHNPLFHIFVQVGEDSLGKGDAADLGPRQEGSLQSLTPAPLPWQWCEKHKLSGRQMLGDLLIKPHQRITKYPLLLQAVLKRTPKPQAREALTAMIAAMESFLQHINKQVRQGEEQESLVAAARRIGPYEVLEPSSEEVEKNLRPFSTLDLMAPMLGVAPEHTRQLLFEGPARVKEGREGKLDVYLFLFSDVLLVTKPPRKADKAKVIRPPLMLEKLVCRPLRDPSSFLLIHLTEFQCVSSALTVHCPSTANRARWLEKTQQAQATLQKLKAEEYIQQKRELLALYRDRDGESPCTRPSTPSQEGSQNSTEGRTCESSTVIPHLVVTEDTDDDAPSVPDDTSDSGYGTLIPGSPKESHSSLSRLRLRALRRDPRLTFSTLELRDVPLRPQPSDPQAPQRRSAPVLPEEGVRKAGSLPRVDPPTWSEEEDRTSTGENVVVETLQRAQLRGQLCPSPTHADSSEESPWESSGDEEEGYLFQGPDYTPSPHPLRPEDMLREIREELASQRIEGVPEPGDSRPRKLTRVQLQRMRGSHVVHLDTPLSTSDV